MIIHAPIRPDLYLRISCWSSRNASQRHDVDSTGEKLEPTFGQEVFEGPTLMCTTYVRGNRTHKHPTKSLMWDLYVNTKEGEFCEKCFP